MIIIITYLESFKSLYHKAFYKFVLSVLSLPIFLYAVIKFFFSAKRKNFYANNSEISEIEQALHQKYKYLSQQKSSQIHKEALKIFKAQSSNTSSRILNKHIFTTSNVLFHKFIMIKVILALPMFILLTFYLQPLVRYIFERIVMAVIVIIGVIVSVFTILYFSPLDAAYSILGQNIQQRHRYINSMYYIILTNLILFNCGIPSRVFLPLT